MGKLIKNHWARLIVLAAATCMGSPLPLSDATDSLADQIAAALEAFFWPKFFFDFLTKNLDSAVKPVPVLQILNLIFALITLAYEWPLKWIAGTHLQRSMVARLLWLPLASLSAVLLYQGTNAALYYLIGVGIYFWAYSEGEVSFCAAPNMDCSRLTCLLRWFAQYHGHCLSGRIGRRSLPRLLMLGWHDV